MNGRHVAPTEGSSPRRRVVAGTAVAALAGAVAWVAVRADGNEAAAGSGPCSSTTTVRVSATPDMAPVVRKVGAQVAEQRCAVFTVTAAASPAALEEVVDPATAPDVWIPDSTLWVERASVAQSGPRLQAGPSVAVSPLVIAAPPAMAQSLAGRGAPSWKTLLGGSVPARLSQPDASTAGLIALLTARQAMGTGPAVQQALGGAIIALSRSAAPDVETLFARADRGGPGIPAFPASEQQVAAYDATHQDAPLAAVVPAEGTGAYDYPFVAVGGRDAKVTGAVEALRAAMTGEAGRRAVTQAGFRTSAAGPGPRVPGMTTTAPRILPRVSLADADAALRTWSSVATDMRMIAVVDVSGSMKQAAGSRSRIALAQSAAQTALRIFPASSQVGLWEFSIGRGGPGQDWRQLVPIGQLEARHSVGTQRDALLAAAGGLASRVGGDTGLYDTILGSYLSVRSGYDPRRINSVVVLTDGKNEDPSGLSLDQLLSRLRAAADPAKPIPVITVGMGPEADAATLAKISRQTGGKAYVAKDPRDIQRVFVDALLQRQCRPDCS